MTSLPESLPPEVLQRILLLASDDPLTLLRCEATSRTLRQAVANDAIWARVPGIHKWRHDSRLSTNRMRACINKKLSLIRTEQKCTTNILVDVLGVDAFRAFVCSAAALGVDFSHQYFSFRGDTLFVLSELLQTHMIHELCWANRISCRFAEVSGQYPILTADDLQLGLELQSITTEVSSRTIGQVVPDQSFLDTSNGLVHETLRYDIIRRLSHRAGVARMANQAFPIAWGKMVHTLVSLLRHVMLELYWPHTTGDEHEQTVLAPGETIHMFPPRASTFVCENCGSQSYLYTPVPRHISDAARSLRMTIDRVYGNGWLVEDTSDYSDELAAAETEYMFLADFEMSDQEDGGGVELPVAEREVQDSMSIDGDNVHTSVLDRGIL